MIIDMLDHLEGRRDSEGDMNGEGEVERKNDGHIEKYWERK